MAEELLVLENVALELQFAPFFPVQVSLRAQVQHLRSTHLCEGDESDSAGRQERPALLHGPPAAGVSGLGGLVVCEGGGVCL